MRLSTLLLSFAAFVGTTSAFAPAFVTRTTTYSPTTLFMSDEEEGGVQSGTVKWFNTMKGFGFIVPDDGSADVFVHQTAIRTEGFRSLADGERVEYKVETDDTGRTRAVGVTGPDGQDVQGAPFRPQNDYEY